MVLQPSVTAGADRKDGPESFTQPAVAPADRADDLIARMTLREKIAQLYGLWVGFDESGAVAPHQHDFAAPAVDVHDLVRHGLGQLTRPYGTAPVGQKLVPSVWRSFSARSWMPAVSAYRHWCTRSA